MQAEVVGGATLDLGGCASNFQSFGLCWHTFQGAIFCLSSYPGIASLDLGLMAIMPPA